MDYTKRVFIQLLADCICAKKSNEQIDFEKLDSEELLYLSRVNTVSAIVYSSIKDLENVPSDLLDELKKEFMRTVMKISKTNTVLDMVVEKLDSSSIPYALVKGKTIAKYYPSEELRDMGDIDILVSPDDFDRAKDLFDTFCSLKPEQVDNKYEISYMLNEVTIELQNNLAYDKNLSGKADYESFFKDLIDHKTKDDDLSVIEPSYSFIFNIYHMAQHFYYGGCGVRMIIDLAVLIRHFKDIFDWEEVLETLKELELYDFAMNVFSIIDDWFDIKIPSGYERREVSDECKEFFIEAGIFGRAKINSDVGNIIKQESFFRWAFPSYKYMRETNEWFKNKPAALLPMAYIIRMFRSLKYRGGIVKGISVTGQTSKDLKAHSEMVKTMGL